MSATDWHDVEAPNAPEGIADLADDSAPTRVDEVTGGTPGDVASQEYVDADSVGTEVDPIAVVIVDKKVDKPVFELATGQFRLAEDSIVQIVGRSLTRRTVNIKARCEATDGTDFVRISPHREDLDVGYRLDHAEKEEFAAVSEIYAKAIGGFADIYYYSEDLD